MYSIVFLLLFSMENIQGAQRSFPVAKVTVKVKDEQSKPIPKADVMLVFYEKNPLEGRLQKRGQTNIHGEFSAEGYSDRSLGGSVDKEGYYGNGAGSDFEDAKNGKWQPWNLTSEILLRPIGKPVAMYAKRSWIDIPEIDKPCGYDLEKGDWVAPYGKGIVSDLIFKLFRKYTSQDDFEVKVEN
jgi:hypothetical protein